MENPTQAPAEVPIPVCPHCRQPLSEVRWLINAEVGLITLYHAECMTVLNCQMVQLETRILRPGQLPSGLFGAS